MENTLFYHKAETGIRRRKDRLPLRMQGSLSKRKADYL
jgi:hypothetical protein